MHVRASCVAGLCAGIMMAAEPASGQSVETPQIERGESPLHQSVRLESGSPFSMKKHPTLRIGSLGEVSLQARFEATARTPDADQGRTQTDLLWKQQRLELQGAFLDRLEFALSGELTDVEEPERDAFVNVRAARTLELRAGRFKLPFGRDALTGGSNLDFVFRSLAGRQLSPGRDVGVMAHGRLFGRFLAYEAGYFGRDGDNARTAETHGGNEALAGRIVLAPFAADQDAALAGLEVGAAVVRSELANQLGLRGRTVFGEGVFFDRVFVNGVRMRRGLEAAWTIGPASVAGEFITVADERRGMGAAGEALPHVRATGWYVAGTWAITGEKKRGRLDPRRSLWKGGPGAVELATRIERLAFESVSHPGTPLDGPDVGRLSANAEHAATVGVAWYPSRYLKLQADFVAEVIDRPQRSPAPRANGRFPSVVVLVQFAL